MFRRPKGLPIAAACLLLIGGLTAVAGGAPARVVALLQQRLPFTSAESAALDRGRAVSKSLRTGDRREVAAGGAILVAVPTEFFLQQFADIERFKQSPIVRQIGKFGSPPRLEDLERLTFEPADLDALRSCRVGHCDLQLGAEQIRQVQTELDWSRPDVWAQANRALRAVLFAYVERYHRSGNQALLEYADDREPLRVSDEVALLVSHSKEMLSGVPRFSEALLGPAATRPPFEDFLYWSKEQFGLKPVISITHVIMYQPKRPEAPDAVVASKQIYASRYLAGSLAITVGIDASTPGAPAFYMAYANRTRPRAFPPVIGGLVRRVAQSRARDGIEEQLHLAKQRLELAYRATR